MRQCPSPGDWPRKALSDMALSMVLRRMGIKDATTHGFRSAFRDWSAERTSFPHELSEMALAHAIESKTEKAYRRGDPGSALAASTQRNPFRQQPEYEHLRNGACLNPYCGNAAYGSADRLIKRALSFNHLVGLR
jgi:hypothetical protein